MGVQRRVKYQKGGIKPTGRTAFKICISSRINTILVDEMHNFKDEMQKKLKKSCFFGNI
jgi:hypothetical protein